MTAKRGLLFLGTFLLIVMPVICQDEKEKPVTRDDLIGKWVLVKMGAMGVEKSEKGDVPKLYYNDQRQTLPQVVQYYKTNFTPAIDKYDEKKIREFKADGSGGLWIEHYVNEKLALCDHDKKSWKTIGAIPEDDKEEFSWQCDMEILKIRILSDFVLEMGIYKSFTDRKNIQYNVNWVIENTVTYLLIDGEGIYRKIEQ